MDLASLSNALQELSILAREAKRGQGEHGEGAHEEGRAAEEQMLKTQALVLDEIQRVEEMIDAHAHAGGHEAAAAARRVAHMAHLLHRHKFAVFGRELLDSILGGGGVGDGYHYSL